MVNEQMTSHASDEQRTRDREIKRNRVLSILRDRGAKSVVLTSDTALNWYLDGGRYHVNLSVASLIALRIGYDEDVLFLTSNERERLVAEELPDGLEIVARPWYEDLPASLAVYPTDLTEADIQDELRAARAVLLPGELTRYRELCLTTAELMTDAMLLAEPMWTEQQLAADIASRLIQRGIDALVVLVGGESRQTFPHPLPTSEPLGQRALLVVGARKDGLIANASRWVTFSELSHEEHERQERLLSVEANIFQHMLPGTPLRDILDVIKRSYKENGFSHNQWALHHQGGAAGYAGRDPRATPNSDDIVHLDQAFAWNPWVPGAKVEDTILLRGEKSSGEETCIDILTEDPRWPTTTINGYQRPVPLER